MPWREHPGIVLRQESDSGAERASCEGCKLQSILKAKSNTFRDIVSVDRHGPGSATYHSAISKALMRDLLSTLSSAKLFPSLPAIASPAILSFMRVCLLFLRRLRRLSSFVRPVSSPSRPSSEDMSSSSTSSLIEREERSEAWPSSEKSFRSSPSSIPPWLLRPCLRGCVLLSDFDLSRPADIPSISELLLRVCASAKPSMCSVGA